MYANFQKGENVCIFYTHNLCMKRHSHSKWCFQNEVYPHDHISDKISCPQDMDWQTQFAEIGTKREVDENVPVVYRNVPPYLLRSLSSTHFDIHVERF